MSDAVGLATPLIAPPRATAQAGIVAAADVDRLARPLAELAERAAEDNLFFHPDFLLPAMACFAPGMVGIATVSARGDLIAAAPFVRTRLGRIAPAVRVWSHDYGPVGVPLVDAAGIEETAATLLATLAPTEDGRCLIIPDLPLAGAVAAALARAARATRRSATVISRYRRAVAAGAGRTGAQGLSHHRRHEAARLLRRLGEQGEVVLATAREAGAVRTAFADFLALEASGWKGKGRTALASDPSRRAFAEAVVSARAGADAVRIHLLRLDGRAIAGLVTLISGRTAFTWKIAYDEGFSRWSPGAQVMLAAVTTLSAEPTVERIDSCAGADHPLADPLLPDRAEMGTFVISPVGEGSLFRAGLAAARAEVATIAAAKRVRGEIRARFG